MWPKNDQSPWFLTYPKSSLKINNQSTSENSSGTGTGIEISRNGLKPIFFTKGVGGLEPEILTG